MADKKPITHIQCGYCGKIKPIEQMGADMDVGYACIACQEERAERRI